MDGGEEIAQALYQAPSLYILKNITIAQALKIEIRLLVDGLALDIWAYGQQRYIGLSLLAPSLADHETEVDDYADIVAGDSDDVVET